MTVMKDALLEVLKKAAVSLGIEASSVTLGYPDDPGHGDFATNIALVNAKKLGLNPRVLADKIVAEFEKLRALGLAKDVETVSVAGPGFVNFKFVPRVFAEEVVRIGTGGAEYGWSEAEKGRKVMVEHTDPNTFKVLHIGHLMVNAIGESLSRLIQASGAEVIRICYPSDIGLHIAKSIWAWQKNADNGAVKVPADDAPIQERTTFLGKMYVEGTQAYEADIAAKDDIDALNKVIYEKSSPFIDELYEKGRKWSLDHFEKIYETLGTKFDEYIYESEMAPVGLEIVHSNTKSRGTNTFEESEGAVVFKGEDHGLHTRVFVNSKGLPTYEAKEVGLNITKFKKHPDAVQSIIITASEQNDYFKVLTKVLSLIDPKDGDKTRHIGHGMMRFAFGKMSSRTGKVITAEALLADMRSMVADKISAREGGDFSTDEVSEISDAVAVAAIKYTILRASIGSDIIFDSAASISFEGDSGPYLQYSAVRAGAVLQKADVRGESQIILPEKVGQLERFITRFPDVIARARAEYAPQHVTTYLIELAAAFNSFYASQVIVDKNDPLSPYYVVLTQAFRTVMINGLWVLGIRVPKRM